jgi:hypothetical protein
MTTLCFECDAIADHWHHVVPKSKGGVRTIPLCQQCHAKVHSPHLLTTCRLTKDALRQKKLRGERIGQVPFGYDLASDGVQLICNEFEMLVIRDIHEMRNRRIGYNKIATRLNQKGIRTKKGGKWMASQVWCIVQRTMAEVQKQGAAPKFAQGVLF